jgi:hypothetical protein
MHKILQFLNEALNAPETGSKCRAAAATVSVLTVLMCNKYQLDCNSCRVACRST